MTTRSQTRRTASRTIAGLSGLGAAALSLCLGGTACQDATGPGTETDTDGIGSSAHEVGAPDAYTTFESGQVRPLALTPDEKYLLAANTPDGKLEIFRVQNGGGGAGLIQVASVPVGLEPVAVAARSNEEAWVVNLLSDDVSVVALDGKKSHVTRTLNVGDEPRDIVFAGPGRTRAFITTAHRGQNVPYDPQFTTPGVGRADVWVFDAASAATSPLTIVQLFSDTPRALAVTPDGSKVYAASFASGNGTASSFVGNILTFTSTIPLGPFINAFGEPAPLPSTIVRYANGHWTDEGGQNRDGEMMFSLPDKDVFVIDANASPPAQLAGSAGAWSGVGTILFNMIVNPVNGKVYVSNLESNNQQRFEGANVFGAAETHPDASVRGRLAFSRISVLDSGGVQARHLNKHIDYDTCCAAVPNDENARSVAFPLDMAITGDGATLYVASLGTSEVAVYDTAALEDDTFVPDTADQIHVTGGGPTGLQLDETRGRLYVLTRFDNSISIIDTATKAETGHVAMYNPEPPQVVAGRRFLYDASLSSSHGDSACASCHIFGDMDQLAWDLGNPDAPTLLDPNMFVNPSDRKVFHSMKGPMITQSLRGMDNHGPMHWRGDRTGGYAEPTAQPNSGGFNENAAFMAFQPAFAGLLGRDVPISTADMQAFTLFILEVMYPPNPVRNLDNSLTPQQQAGFDVFFGPHTFFDPDGPELTCNQCHTLDRTANEGLVARPGFFGTNGQTAEVAALQTFKTPHLRNQYVKVGMFGMQFSPILSPSPDMGVFMGDQIRGFGYNHDGGFDTSFRFLHVPNFADTVTSIFPPFKGIPVNNPEGMPITAAGEQMRRDLEAYMLAFDSNHRPIVGQQATLPGDAAAHARVDLLIARAEAGECELIARGDQKEGYLYDSGLFVHNRSADSASPDAALRATATASHQLTYTCTPLGNGRRMGLDRDLDGYRDGDEYDADTNPADPSSHP